MVSRTPLTGPRELGLEARSSVRRFDGLAAVVSSRLRRPAHELFDPARRHKSLATPAASQPDRQASEICSPVRRCASREASATSEPSRYTSEPRDPASRHNRLSAHATSRLNREVFRPAGLTRIALAVQHSRSRSRTGEVSKLPVQSGAEDKSSVKRRQLHQNKKSVQMCGRCGNRRRG